VIAVAQCGADRQARRQGRSGEDNPGKAIMNITVRAVVAVFSLGTGLAHAGDGDGYSATTLFTSIQNEQAARPRAAAAQNGAAPVQTSDASDAQQHGKTTWLFRVFSAP